MFPATQEELARKFRFIGEMLEKMGLPLFDDSIRALVDDFLAQMAL